MTNHDDAARLAGAVRRLSRELTFVIRAQPSGVELTFTESQVIEFVHRFPGITMAELSTRSRVKKSNISTAISSLEQRGFISRQRGATDGRVSHLSVTEKSLAVMSLLSDAWADAIDATVDATDGSRIADAAELIESIVDRLGATTTPIRR